MEALQRSLLAGGSAISWAYLQAALRDMQAGNETTLPEKAVLQNCELWKQFHGITNEMIVTKAGR